MFINFYFVNISKCVVVLRLQKELKFFCYPNWEIG